MICPYCNKEAKYGPNEEWYGRRFGKSYMCYYCKDCDAYVGTHQNTTKALGTMANKELRNMRMKCHALFDPLWKQGNMKRSMAYKMISDEMGKQVHIGESDLETCKRILEYLTDYTTKQTKLL